MSKERFRQGQLRYMTRGISERLPPEIQIILWRMVDSLKNEIKLDYLQVFRLETLGSLEDDSLVQVIIHEQEKPQYSRRYYFPDLRIGVTGKVYIIDDGEHSTMLWERNIRKEQKYELFNSRNDSRCGMYCCRRVSVGVVFLGKENRVQ